MQSKFFSLILFGILFTCIFIFSQINKKKVDVNNFSLYEGERRREEKEKTNELIFNLNSFNQTNYFLKKTNNNNISDNNNNINNNNNNNNINNNTTTTNNNNNNNNNIKENNNNITNENINDTLIKNYNNYKYNSYSNNIFSFDTNINISPKSTGQELESIYEKVIFKQEYNCSNKVRLGNENEGGWSMCLDKPFIPAIKNCLVYSFGINNDWSFDDAIVNKFSCLDRAFDPSIKKTNFKKSDKILFYAEGLAGKDFVNDKMWRLNKFSSLLNLFKDHNKTIDYLKIDVEYWEWESLEEAMKDGVLFRVKQLALELHRDEIFSKTTSVSNYFWFLRILKGLKDLGFMKWYFHVNPYSTKVKSKYSNQSIMCCHEIVLVNKNFI